MTRKELFAKYPRPWTFHKVDKYCNGIIVDANDQLMVILKADWDWREGVPEDEDPEDRAYEPVFNGSGPVYGTPKPEDIEAEEARDALIDALLFGTIGGGKQP